MNNDYGALMEWCWQGKVLDENQSQPHFVYHKYHIYWPVTGRRHPQWESYE